MLNISRLKGFFKKYGLLIGVAIVILELIDHLILPLALTYCQMYKTAVFCAAFPITEVCVYPAIALYKKFT